MSQTKIIAKSDKIPRNMQSQEDLKSNIPLIKDLSDLKNQYLDPISYLKLIALKPEEFNPKVILSILETYEKQVPIATFLSAYQLAREYAEKWTEMEVRSAKTKIDPLYITSLILRKISFEGETISGVDDTHPREGIYTEVENSIQNLEENLEVRMNEIIDYPSYFTSDNLLIEKIKQMDDLYDTDDPKYQKYFPQTIAWKAWEILKEKDPDVYDTSDWHIYKDKLVPIFFDLIREIEIIV